MAGNNYQFSFIFHETGAPIDLYFETYEQALASAKFHCQAFIEEAWRRSVSNRNILSTNDEFVKIAGDFKLEPNEQNFSFSDYFLTYYKLLEFREEMENIWRGMISQ